MNTKIKSALLLLTILFIGVVAGVLGSHLYVQHRIQKFHSERGIRGERFLQHRFEQLLVPTPEQAVVLDSVFEKYDPKFRELNQRMRTESMMLLDSLHAELKPILTKKQMELLESRRRGRPFDRRFGRPDVGRPMDRGNRRPMMPDDIPEAPPMPPPND